MIKPPLHHYVLAALVAFGFLSSSAKAQTQGQDFLLFVDDSNPSAVTFTGTGNDPLISDSSHRYSQGIVLADFVTTPTLIPGFNATTAGLVTGVDGTPAYSGTQSGSITATFADLQLYTGSAAFEDFSATTAAFSGTSTFNFAADASVLPASGFIGAIYAGSGQIFSPTPEIIGYYQVTSAAPEPSTYAMMLGGLVLLGVRLRRQVIVG